MKKKSFAEALAEHDACLHNSNLTNLVSAIENINRDLEWLEETRIALVNLQVEIEAAARNPETLTTDRTKELYDRSYDIMRSY